MLDLREIHSMAEFQRNIQEYVGGLEENKEPLLLTVDDHTELVVQDAGSYQLILERLEQAETVAAVRRGLEQADRGEGIPLEEAARRLRKKHGFSS